MPRRSPLTRMRELAAFARRISSLGPSRAAAAKLWLAAFALPLKARVPFLAPVPLRVTVRVGDAVHAIALADRSDFQVLEEVLLERAYDVRPAQEPTAVVDLGAHVGISALWFHGAFPATPILAVEPDPATFSLLERNVGPLPRVRVRRAAVGAAPGRAAVARDGLSWTSRVVAAPGGDVDVVTLDDLIASADAQAGLLLKVDVEGDEWDVLSGSDLRPFATIVGELHPASLPVSVDEFFALFDDFEVTRPADAAGHGSFSALRRAEATR